MKKIAYLGLSIPLLFIFSACKKDNPDDLSGSSANHVILHEGREDPVDPICLGELTKYLLVFTNGSSDANWQGATKGFVGDVAINGVNANERTSGGVPYAGNLYTNANGLDAWGDIINQNPGQSQGFTNESSRINGLTTDLNNVFTLIKNKAATIGFEGVSSTSLNGLNTQDGTAQIFVINITSGMQVSSKINITGDAGDLYILRWDNDGNPLNGYQGVTKFQSGGGIVPNGNLIATNFINVAGDISSSGGGSNPAIPYPQGPRYANGFGNLITNGSDFNGGGFFTGYWFTTGDPVTGQTHSLSNAIFVGGWYTSSGKFSMTSGTSGVYVAPPESIRCN